MKTFEMPEIEVIEYELDTVIAGDTATNSAQGSIFETTDWWGTDD